MKAMLLPIPLLLKVCKLPYNLLAAHPPITAQNDLKVLSSQLRYEKSRNVGGVA